MKVASSVQAKRNAGRSRRFRQSNAEPTFRPVITAPIMFSTSFVYPIPRGSLANIRKTTFSRFTPSNARMAESFLYFPLVSRPTFHVLCANRFLRVYSVAITAAHLNLIHKALPPLRLRNLTRIFCSRLFPQEIGKETPWTKPVDYAAE